MRLLPWWQEAAHRDVLGPLSDCQRCMKSQPKLTRQMLGCGYEVPPERKFLPMVRARQPSGYKDATPVVCPGYTTNLPEVIEVARARFWRDSLVQFCGGKPREELMMAIEILEGSDIQRKDWAMTPASKGGGMQA